MKKIWEQLNKMNPFSMEVLRLGLLLAVACGAMAACSIGLLDKWNNFPDVLLIYRASLETSATLTATAWLCALLTDMIASRGSKD